MRYPSRDGKTLRQQVRVTRWLARALSLCILSWVPIGIVSNPAVALDTSITLTLEGPESLDFSLKADYRGRLATQEGIGVGGQLIEILIDGQVNALRSAVTNPWGFYYLTIAFSGQKTNALQAVAYRDSDREVRSSTLSVHRKVTIRPSSSPQIETLAAGDSHTCAVMSDGSVRCWGANPNGQLGDGTKADGFQPVRANTSGSRAKSLAGGHGHTCGLMEAGEIICWGKSDERQLDHPFDRATAVTAGRYHSCALLDNGSVSCWGKLDRGGGVLWPFDNDRLASIRAAAIISGDNHACALIQGTMSCWGSNGSGQLGVPNTIDFLETPRTVPNLEGVVGMAAGFDHSCALIHDGKVKCWGKNNMGQLGLGYVNEDLMSDPIEVEGVSNAVAVSAGHHHSCAVIGDGTAKCWGWNYFGQLGNGQIGIDSPTATGVAGLTNARSLTLGHAHTCALTGNGEALCWGRDRRGHLGGGESSFDRFTPTKVENLSDAFDLGAGEGHTCSVTDAGVSCWGWNDESQLGNEKAKDEASTPFPVSGLASAEDVSLGEKHACALTSGTVRCWGQNTYGQLGDETMSNSNSPVPVAGLEAVSSLSLGQAHSCALTSGGQVYCWGDNRYGQLGDGSWEAASLPKRVIEKDSIAIAAGSYHMCALMTDRTARCWGNNSFGQVGGRVLANSIGRPIQVEGLTNIKSLSLGDAHSCAVTNSGEIKCWGSNARGQLGSGSSLTVLSSSPINVPGIDSARMISAGDNHTCVALADGHTKCWGANAFGQLGDGTATDRYGPVMVEGLPSVRECASPSAESCSLSAGGAFTCALTVGGEGRCWGSNKYGQLGIFRERLTPSPVFDIGEASHNWQLDPGGSHSCSVLTNGTGACWGANENGQLGDGTNHLRTMPEAVVFLEGINSISTGMVHSCASKVNGGVACWGDNTFGQLGLTDKSQAFQPIDVASPNHINSVSSGAWHTCSVGSRRSVFCWGRNDAGQLGAPLSTAQSPTPHQVAVAGVLGLSAGQSHTCAVTFEGSVSCWGSNSAGQLGVNSLALSSTPLETDITEVRKVSAGSEHTCVLNYSGQMYCWGSNSHGQLANTSVTATSIPTRIPGLEGVLDISTGARHSCALLSDAVVHCWGDDSFGQLGRLVTQDRSSPSPVVGVTGISISSGDDHTCALIPSGGFECWGRNDSGQIGDGGLVTRPSGAPIAPDVTMTTIPSHYEWDGSPTTNLEAAFGCKGFDSPVGVDRPGCESKHFQVDPPSSGAAFGVTVEASVYHANDIDLYIYGPKGELIASSYALDETPGLESASVNITVPGLYTVRVHFWLSAAASYHGTANLLEPVPSSAQWDGEISTGESYSWKGDPPLDNNPFAICDDLDRPTCDNEHVKVNASSGTLTITIIADESGEDFDVCVYDPDGQSSCSFESGNETLTLSVTKSGIYRIEVIAYRAAGQYSGTAALA